ncbi:MAG TPA: hypothetical protein VK530_04625 [Candidatus Acidoferrum sp.]|nr:hypothetical protein [Candidatus Acidoferrum sp.]
MSNQQLEEQRARRQAEAVAIALGMAVEDLEAQEWSMEADVGNDDMIYGYIVTLEDGRKAHITLPDE